MDARQRALAELAASVLAERLGITAQRMGEVGAVDLIADAMKHALDLEHAEREPQPTHVSGVFRSDRWPRDEVTPTRAEPLAEQLSRRPR